MNNIYTKLKQDIQNKGSSLAYSTRFKWE